MEREDRLSASQPIGKHPAAPGSTRSGLPFGLDVPAMLAFGALGLVVAFGCIFNARGSFFDLGLGEDENLLLAGPSTRGLADPGMGACVALFQTTVSLLNERPDVDEVVTMLVLQQLVSQIEDALLWANVAHDAEAERRRNERADGDESTPGIPADRRLARLHRLRGALTGWGAALRTRR